MKTRVVHVNDQVPGAVYIGRAMPRRGLKASPLANPYKIGSPSAHDGTPRSRTAVMELFDLRMRERLEEEAPDYDGFYGLQLRELVGKPLACWCRHDGEERTDDTACHGDVLIEIIRELGLEPDDADA